MHNIQNIFSAPNWSLNTPTVNNKTMIFFGALFFGGTLAYFAWKKMNHRVTPKTESDLPPTVAIPTNPSLSDLQNFENFYLNGIPNTDNKTLLQMWNFSFAEKEWNHEYIQWMFPIDVKSTFNDKAPVCTVEEFLQLRQNPKIVQNIRTSFASILEFYGLQYHEGTHEVVQGKDFEERSKAWRTQFDHNHLRITRILRCLSLFGLNNEALAFNQYLQTFKDKNIINEESFTYWENAAQPIERPTHS